MLKKLKEDVEKLKKMVCKQIRNIGEERKSEKKPKEILELKSAITEMKNTPEDFKGKFE